ncbi:MAG: hypothetical protein WBG13_29710 [Pseudolabrys sp.]
MSALPPKADMCSAVIVAYTDIQPFKVAIGVYWVFRGKVDRGYG